VRKLAFALFVPFVLAACAGPSLPTQELRDLKPACASGDTSACSDIGHTIRRDRAESAYNANT
jgi:hypothetical protein